MSDNDNNFDALADEIRGYLTRFAYFPNEASADVATLWAMSTHATDNDGQLVFASHPRMAILSHGPGSGKTRVLELIESISKNGKRVTDPSAPGMLTLINEENATLAIDEIDLLFGKSSASQRPLRSILNSGYRPGATIARMGKEWNTYAPVILAGMRQNFLSNESLKPLVTRSICIEMAKKPEGATIDPYRERLHGPIAKQLQNAISYWAQKNINFLATCWPTLPDKVEDRNADLWEPMVAVGEAIGPRWKAKAFKACEQFVLSAQSDDARPLSPQESLLFTLSRIVGDNDSLTTAQILEELANNSAYWRSFPSIRSAAMELSSLLKPLGVTPVKLWDSATDRALQGYRTDALRDHLPTFQPSDLDESEDTEDVHALPI